jgi:hypothetical protein
MLLPYLIIELLRSVLISASCPPPVKVFLLADNATNAV